MTTGQMHVSPDQELSERGQVQRQVDPVNGSVLQIQAGYGYGPIDDGLVLGLLQGAGCRGVGIIA